MDEDSRSHKSVVLRYGQVIRVHLEKKEKRGGVLVAKGFTDRSVSLMRYQHFKCIPNYRESLFQVLPRGTFEIHDEFQKTRDENAKQRMKTEQDQFKMQVAIRMEEEVVFGAEVVLLHLDSQCYLQGSYECSEYATDAFKVQLGAALSSEILFRLLPYQSFQQEGHPIYIDEPLVIQHEKSKCKLDYYR